jgi:hypothetical protein
MKRDYYGTAFKYILDGGYPRFCQFISSKMSILVEDHQIYANVMISRQGGNKIEVGPDGGLLVRDQWATQEDMEELVRDTENMYNYYGSLLPVYAEDIHVIADDDLINARIIDCIDGYISPMIDVLQYEDISVLDRTFHSVVDSKIDALEDEFGDVTILGKWSTLTEE